MVRPMRKTRAPTQSQRAIGHIAALQSIATMFVMHAMVGRSTLQFKMPRLDAYSSTTRICSRVFAVRVSNIRSLNLRTENLAEEINSIL